MEYIASIRVGLNEIKALTQLEVWRRGAITPLLNMRGKDQRHLDTFLKDWTDHPFFMDISASDADAKDAYLLERNLLSPVNCYEARRAFFDMIASGGNQLIPVVSWHTSHSARETTQLALKLERDYELIAIRPQLFGRYADKQWTRTRNILNAVSDLSRVWLLLDAGPIEHHTAISNMSTVVTALDALKKLELAGISVLSTSFPEGKPASGTSRTVPCLDLAAQSLINTGDFKTPLTYGDYGGSNPAGVMEYVPGMQVLPFASYFTDGEWWQTRRGSDKEFGKYVEIAQDIRSLPGYHTDSFCWATTEIARIAGKVGGNGNNGSWNGIRVNQHLCAMLEYLNSVGYPVSVPGTSPSSDDDEDI